MALPKYGSDNSSLWTPTATGDFPVETTTICAWIDGEDSDQMTLSPIADQGSGSYQITNLVEKGIGTVTFSRQSGYEVPNFSDGTGSLLINNRNSIYFWEDSLQYIPDCTLTAPIGAFDGILPGGDDERLVYMVFQTMEHRPYDSANFIYSYGTTYANGLFSLAIWATGSSTTSPQAFFLQRSSSPNPYYEQAGPVYLYSTPGTPQFITQHHAGGNGTLSNDNNQTEYTYSSITLNTVNTNTQFWLTEEVGGGGRGIRILFGELLILNSTVGQNDRQRIEGYLAHKWSFTDSLAPNHPYKVDPPYNTKWVRQPQVPPNPAVTNSFVINRYKNVAYDYTRTQQVLQTPFSKGINGPSNLRKRITAHSSSL